MVYFLNLSLLASGPLVYVTAEQKPGVEVATHVAAKYSNLSLGQLSHCTVDKTAGRAGNQESRDTASARVLRSDHWWIWASVAPCRRCQ